MAKRKPRKRDDVKAVPRILITSKDGFIDIREYYIEISGTIESAAIALAEDILTRKKNIPDAERLDYRSIEVLVQDGKCYLNLRNRGAIDAEKWNVLKKSVEKVCNNLKAFL